MNRAAHRAPLLTRRSRVQLLVVVVATGMGAIVTAQPLLGTAGLLLAVGAGIVLVKPDYATLTVIALIYSNAAVVAVHSHGMPSFVAAVVPLSLVLPVAHALLIRRQPLIIAPALPWIMGYFLVQVAGTILAVDQPLAVDRLTAFILEGFCLFLAITNSVRTERVLRQAVWVLLGVGALLGTLSLAQALTSTYESDYAGFAQVSEAHLERRQLADPADAERNPMRQGGPLGQFNRYAQIMLVLVPIGLLRMRDERRMVLRVTAAVATALICAGIALTYSRGAAVAMALLLVAMAIRGHIKPVELGAVLIVITILLLSFPRYVERITSITAASSLVSGDGGADQPDGAILGRLAANLGALRVFVEHPIIGVGPGQYPIYHREQAVEVGLRVAESRQPHNLFPHIAAETGALGFLFFFGAIVVTLGDLRRARRWSGTGARPPLAAMASGFTYAIFAYLATGIFLHLAYFRYFWVLLALAAATGSIAREHRAQAGADHLLTATS